MDPRARQTVGRQRLRDEPGHVDRLATKRLEAGQQHPGEAGVGHGYRHGTIVGAMSSVATCPAAAAALLRRAGCAAALALLAALALPRPVAAADTPSARPAASAASRPARTPAKPDPERAARKAEQREQAARKAVTAAVKSWAKAWSRRDAKAYLGAYAPGFISADRTLRPEAWAAQRRQDLREAESIRIEIDRLELDPKGDDWVASFVETSLIDGRFREVRKQLLLRRIQGRWLIIGEREDG
jgi:ketosteroid isomerase-like protein